MFAEIQWHFWCYMKLAGVLYRNFYINLVPSKSLFYNISHWQISHTYKAELFQGLYLWVSCQLSVYIFYHYSIITFLHSVYAGDSYVLTFLYILSPFFFLSWDQNSIIDKKGRCGFHSYFMEIYKTNFEPNASALIWNYKLANINALLRFAISKGIYQDRFAFEGLIKLCAHLAKLPTLQKYFYV